MKSTKVSVPEVPSCLSKAAEDITEADLVKIRLFVLDAFSFISMLQDDILNLQDKNIVYINYIDKTCDAMMDNDAPPEVLNAFRKMALAYIDLHKEKVV